MSRSKPRFFLCGLLQMLWMLAFPLLMTFVSANGFVWVAAGETLPDIYLRALSFSGVAFAGTCVLPILLKWTLVGRWKPRQLRVWSLAYLRFWLVKSLIQVNPLARYAGSPIFSVYLRLLGAKIGRGVLIFSPTVPVCTDLFTVGSGTRHPQGRGHHRLPRGGRCDPDRPGLARPGRLRRRDDRARHRHLDG